MQEIIPFDFKDTPVRVMDRDGEPWFVASDALEILGVDRTSLRGLDEDEKGVDSIHTLGGVQGVTVISESGLYSLIMRSRKPEAKAFKRWVTHEVIPSIRKTGSYGTPQLTGPALYLAAIEQAQGEIAALEAKNRALAPKADSFDGFLSSVGDYSLNEGAKLLARNGVPNMGQNRLRDHLLRWGWLYRGRKERLRASQAAIETGRLAERTSWYYDEETGERQAGAVQAVITPKGLDDVKTKLMHEQGFILSDADGKVLAEVRAL